MDVGVLYRIVHFFLKNIISNCWSPRHERFETTPETAAPEAADAKEARWLAALPPTTLLVARALSSGHFLTSGASIRRGGRGMGPAAAGPRVRRQHVGRRARSVSGV